MTPVTAIDKFIYASPIAGARVDAREAADLPDAAATVGVVCHVYPDADTIGAWSGACPGSLPRRQGGPGEFRRARRAARIPAVAAGWPSAGWSRKNAPRRRSGRNRRHSERQPGLARYSELADPGREVLVIDHHASNLLFGTANYVDPSAYATTMLVTELLDAWEEADRRRRRALPVCLGLITDTCLFRWASARCASTRPGPGARRGQRLDQSRPARHPPVRVAADVVACCRRPSFSPTTPPAVGDWCCRCRTPGMGDARPEEVESIVDIVRTTQQAEVAAVFRKIQPAHWSASMRAIYDLAAVASAFGGGGHRLAAGYSATGSADDVVQALYTALG